MHNSRKEAKTAIKKANKRKKADNLESVTVSMSIFFLERECIESNTVNTTHCTQPFGVQFPIPPPLEKRMSKHCLESG